MQTTNLVPVVINACFGGFGLSEMALNEYNKLSGKSIKYSHDLDRTDPHLASVVKKYKNKSFGSCAALEIHMIPDYMIDYYDISEYDGCETLHLFYDKYKINRIKQIIGDDLLTGIEKLTQINNIVEYVVPDS